MLRIERPGLAALALALLAAPAAAQNPVAAVDTAAARAQAAVDSTAARAAQMEQAAAEAQQQAPAEPQLAPLDQRPMPGAQPINPDEVKLVFDREVYRYEAAGRRDPYKPLTDGNSGPLFEDLTLRMILHSGVPGQSIALLADSRKKSYRLRRGESVGNITVVEITADRVTFSVEDFGVSRREVLSIKPENETEGA